MKEDQLEEFIRGHRADFDDLEPSPLVWEKIEKNNTKKNSFAWKTVLWKAAGIIIIFTCSFIANEFWHQYRNDSSFPQAADQPVKEIKIPELLEAEVYYTSRVEQRLLELREYEKGDPELQKELSIEMKDLDESFSQLKNDLKDDIANEEIVEAMIQNYRIKLKMLEEIIARLKAQKENTDQDKAVEYEI